MSYVAIKGGEKTIQASKRFFKKLFGRSQNLKSGDIQSSLLFSVDRVMGEGALYSLKLASKAISRFGGDLLEAAFALRAHRSTCRRIGQCQPVRQQDMRLIRRISSTFKDIQGGQVLGPSVDYEVKLLTATLSDQVDDADNSGSTDSNYLLSALHPLREKDLVISLESNEEKPFDVTRSYPLPPYPRSAVMQIMARGETGTMLGFAYTSMRGYGDVHPTIGDLRLGYLTVSFTHPFTEKEVKIGEIRATMVETVGSFKRDNRDGKLRLATGFGFCFGFNETKAIAMSILDLAMSHGSYSVGGTPMATSPEMIIHHVDAVESMGFTNHFKLPHYVTFQADLQTFQNARENDQ